jgi:nucleotide-binding universal stress UspA family protein
MYRHIIVGYDGSEHARDAATLALSVAKGADAKVIFVNAFYDVPAVLPADQLRNQLRGDARRAVQQAARGVPSDVAVDTRVISGRSPARALYEYAEECKADLIVVGSSGSAPEGQVVAGRVADQVVDGAPCAVAIAPAGLRHREELELRQIGVGFDGGPASEAALSIGSRIAEASGARLHVISVVEPVVSPLTGPYALEAREAIHESLRVSAREALDEAGRWTPNTIEVKKALLDGPIDETLAREATERDLDLLVVGSRGFGPLRRVLLGSVSAKLMHDAPCALIVVPRGVSALRAQTANEANVVEAG